MTCDSQTKDTFVSFILRVTLGVIFLYHGVEKVREGDLGANWAAKTWGQHAKPPQGVVDNLETAITKRGESLDKAVKDLEKETADLSEKLKKANEDEQEKITEKLEKKQKQLAEARRDKEALEKLSKPLKEQFVASYTMTNLEMPEAFRHYAVQYMVAWGEVAGGAALLLGLLTRVAAVGLMLIQIGAIYTLTAARGLSFGTIAEGGGIEYNVILMVACLALATMGGGSLSLDHLLMRKRKSGT